MNTRAFAGPGRRIYMNTRAVACFSPLFLHEHPGFWLFVDRLDFLRILSDSASRSTLVAMASSGIVLRSSSSQSRPLRSGGRDPRQWPRTDNFPRMSRIGCRPPRPRSCPLFFWGRPGPFSPRPPWLRADNPGFPGKWGKAPFFKRLGQLGCHVHDDFIVRCASGCPFPSGSSELNMTEWTAPTLAPAARENPLASNTLPICQRVTPELAMPQVANTAANPLNCRAGSPKRTSPAARPWSCTPAIPRKQRPGPRLFNGGQGFGDVLSVRQVQHDGGKAFFIQGVLNLRCHMPGGSGGEIK